MSSVLNEMATSGAGPPRIDWVILSSSWLPTFWIVMFGWRAWKPAMTWPRPFSSRSEKALQTVTVAFWLLDGSGVGAGEPEPTPVHPARVRGTAMIAAATANGLFMVLLVGAGR